MTPEDASYLAGITDGEGCFSIAKNSTNAYRVEFIVHLRADDRALLEHLMATTGLGVIHKGRRSKQGGDQPSLRWTIYKRHECQALVAIFERYPLRSKKAKDFTIWSDAVRAWARHDWGRMAELHLALRAARHFEEAGDDWVFEPDPQLAIEQVFA